MYKDKRSLFFCTPKFYYACIINKVVFIAFFLLLSIDLVSATFRSVQNGNWNDASTWTLGAGAGGVEGVDYPAASDIVFIDHYVIINTPNSGSNFSFTGQLTINAGDTLESQVGDNVAGFVLEGNGIMRNNGSFFTLDASEEPDETAHIPYEFVCKDNSVFIGGLNSFAFISDDWQLEDNAQVFIDNLLCYAISDDVNFESTSCNMYGSGNIRIGGDGLNSTVNFNGGSTNAQLDDDITIWRNVASTACSGTSVATGTSTAVIPPFAFADSYNTALNTAQNQSVLYQGTADFSPTSGDTITLSSAGSDAGATNGISAEGGTVVVNNNGTASDLTDDYIVYTPPTGFVGTDTYNYLITNEGGATDIAVVSVTITACGSGFIEDTTLVAVVSQSNASGVNNAANITGVPDANFTEWHDGGDILNLDFGQIYTAGTQYKVTWRVRPTSSTDAQPVIRESTTNGGFTTLVTAYTIVDDGTTQEAIITSENDFRFLQITKDNTVDITDFEIDAIQVLDISCLVDKDNDGIADAADIDDDNDGILDTDEITSAPNSLLNYEFYDGTPSGNTVDNIPTSGALSTGTIGDFDVTSLQESVDPGDADSYGIRYSGNIHITTAGSYTFYTTSDDGSKLFIDGAEIVDNDGAHGAVEVSGGVVLTTGAHDITVLFFESGGGNELSVSYEGPSISKTSLPFSILSDGSTVASDTDNDGTDNRCDLDSDNDGIADIIEAGGVDADGDGIADVLIDTDGDGWADLFDSDNGGTALTDVDTDADGFQNRVDIDSDGDGIVDVIEAQASTATPLVPSGVDSDGDGIDNAFDSDLGNSLFVPVNTDASDIEDYIDTDSDNDGLTDQLEAYDTNNDGTANTSASESDGDNDGLDDNFDNLVGPNGSTNVTNNGQTSNSFPNLDITATTELDWREFSDKDGDGVGDGNDIDIDNDGILNENEVGGTFGVLNYEFYDGTPSGNTVDNIPTSGELASGTISAFDVDAIQTSADPGDADTYAIRFLGRISIATAGSYTFYTSSDDGSNLSIDGVEIVDNDGNHGDTEQSGVVVLTSGFHTIEVLYFENTGDDILTVSYEGPSISKTTLPFSILSIGSGTDDSDNDGVNDNCDLDSDNDGIPDIIEAGGTDSNGDGVVDDATDSDGDGWADTFDSDDGGAALDDPDTDSDGIFNRVDIDSDGDGIIDVIEAQASTGSPITPTGTDSDGDGIDNSFDTDSGNNFLTPENTDGTDDPDYLDTDSDNDGDSDFIEAYDTDNDNIVNTTATGTDTDNDGLDDSFDAISGPNSTTNVTNGGQTSNSFPNIDNSGTSERDWREIIDTDGDGVANNIDIDDDNDGILDDIEEAGCVGSISYEFYDGTPSGNTVDNIPTTGALSSGTVSDFNVTTLQEAVDPGDADSYGIRYSGSINISATGTYTFYTTSDDGSKLFINGVEIVDNDGAHGSVEVSGSLALTAGTHSITVLFFEAGGGNTLTVCYEGPSISKTTVPFSILLPDATCDTDGDGIIDRLDIDSDNDGILDNVEAQTTASFAAPTGLDDDNDGWDNRYDSDNGGTAITLSNNDGAGNPDYLDTDSDGDGFADWTEGFDDDNSGIAFNDLFSRAAAFEIAAGNPMFYVNTDDSDADGTPNWLEDDDADGTPNFLDADNALFQDSDFDGLVDLYDTDNNGLASNTPDGDGDGEFDFRDGDNQIALPIELVYFTAQKMNNKVQLNWETNSEINNHFFIIERSSDGRSWQEVVRRNGAGNSYEKRNYIAYDNSPHLGSNYYRISQFDYDGKHEVFNNLIRHIAYRGEGITTKLYPNPASGKLVYLEMTDIIQGNYEVEIFTATGEVIHRESFAIGAETFLIRKELLKGRKLNKGVYLVRLRNNTIAETLRMIIQ